MFRYPIALLLSLCLTPALRAQTASWTSESFVAQRLGEPTASAELQAAGEAICAYVDQPDHLRLRFYGVPADTFWTLAMPDGGVYLSLPVLAAVAGDEAKTAFLLAATAALAMDGLAAREASVARLLAGEVGPTLLPAVERTLTAERVVAADQTALLCLTRAGIPPLEGVRCLDKLDKMGAGSLTVTPGLEQLPSVAERRARATQAAAELIKAVTEFDFGVIDLVDQRYADAAERFRGFLEILPRNYAGWNNLGLCHYHLAIEPLGPRRFLLADAIAEFDTSYMTRATREPDPVEWARALAALSRAVEIDPGRVEGLTNLGNLYLVKRDWDQSRQWYERALAVNRQFAPALNNYGALLAESLEGDFPRAALEQFAAAAAADPNLAEAQFNLGAARAELGLEGRDEAWQRYLALAPNGAQAASVARQLGGGGGTRPGRGGGTIELPPAEVIGERDIELWNRVRLALESPRRELLALVQAEPDQDRTLPGREISVVGWSRQGLAVELLANRVNRVVAGRPPGHEAQTFRGVRVGYTIADVKEKYGPPPAVSKQSPYTIWLYPRSGLGFFVLGEQVNKIFLFPLAE